MAKGSTFKKEKYEEKILHEVNDILRTKLNDTRLSFVSVTKVDLTPDYSIANLYWDTFDPNARGDAKEAIKKSTSKIRSLLAGKLKVRHIPKLQFEYDSQFESEKAIDELLKSEKDVGKSY